LKWSLDSQYRMVVQNTEFSGAYIGDFLYPHLIDDPNSSAYPGDQGLNYIRIYSGDRWNWDSSGGSYTTDEANALTFDSASWPPADLTDTEIKLTQYGTSTAPGYLTIGWDSHPQTAAVFTYAEVRYNVSIV